MDKLPLLKWLNQKLSVILECEVGDEYCTNILAMNKTEIVSFMNSLIDTNSKQNKDFLNELLNRISSPSSLQSNEFKVYKKEEIESSYQIKNKLASKPAISESSGKPDNNNRKSNQPKAMNINEFQGKSNQFKLSGRYSCDCEASKHKLISNCLKCGRIVCEQEGSGPCLFCGNLVATKQELEKINSGSKKGDILKQQLMSKSWETEGENDLKKAIDHKNKLIEFDRNCTKRTQVIDDESDYFQSNNRWLTQNQREKMSKLEKDHDEKRFASKLKPKTYSFDITGKVVEDAGFINYEKILQEVGNIENEDYLKLKPNFADRNFKIDPPKFVEDRKNEKKTSNKIEPTITVKLPTNLRIQDKELQEMKDDGMCLSMHQPYASMLVCGIKVHEGRSWYSPYRGRLWIHAASKQPSNEDIDELETFYKNKYPGQKLDFPKSYPTSCLLGYVDVIDCMSEESYNEQFPVNETHPHPSTPFTFIVENPCELVVKLPMTGQHKIYKIDRNIFNIARKTAILNR